MSIPSSLATLLATAAAACSLLSVAAALRVSVPMSLYETKVGVCSIARPRFDSAVDMTSCRLLLPMCVLGSTVEFWVFLPETGDHTVFVWETDVNFLEIQMSRVRTVAVTPIVSPDFFAHAATEDGVYRVRVHIAAVSVFTLTVNEEPSVFIALQTIGQWPTSSWYSCFVPSSQAFVLGVDALTPAQLAIQLSAGQSWVCPLLPIALRDSTWALKVNWPRATLSHSRGDASYELELSDEDACACVFAETHKPILIDRGVLPIRHCNATDCVVRLVALPFLLP